MDSLISAAARALAAGDALAALQRVALRDDPPALALRGIAMAQLGEHPRARELLRRAARGFGAHEPVARARCVVAEAEVALALRDLGGPAQALMAAATTLQAHGDVANALQARLVAARKLILLGKLHDASEALAGAQAADAAARLPPSLIAVAELAAAELALRALHIGTARTALQRAQQAANQSGVPALLAEVAQAQALLHQPAARCLASGVEQMLRLEDVAALLASPGVVVVDACRHVVRA
ncbi:MAG: helix-turn-helix domain-containing protein, partial [Comamonadaceae bacterium]